MKFRSCCAALPLASALIACGAAMTPAGPEVQPTAGPTVDSACVARARAGKLLDELPSTLSDFHLRREPDGSLSFIHPGKPLSDAQGEALWAVLGGEGRPRGLSMGSHAASSTEKCEGVADASCIRFDIWLCQTSLEELAATLRSALAQVDAPTAELWVRVRFEESRGPSCTRGPDCQPAPHYSQKNGRYEASASRYPSGPGGRGQCRDDGDCEGQGSNLCQAWYLRGGAETAIYLQMSRPTFCGCVEQLCSWFSQ